ncbi:MAG: AAA family ATPase, partial [Betaproteobacteria bacterium]|nr:AAA family ATPase [Betaproteobacteria bacterium]
MAHELRSLTIKGYKSIKAVDNLPLRRLNVLIGANGAGKSNFISLFRLLERIQSKELQLHVAAQGGPDIFLFGGRSVSPSLLCELSFDNNGYCLELQATNDNRLVFKNEAFLWDYTPDKQYPLGMGHDETRMHDGMYPRMHEFIVPTLSSWRVYHFHDTGENARVKRVGPVASNVALESDAGNLAAFLLCMRVDNPICYDAIVALVKRVAPFFGDFVLVPNGEFIQLRWKKVGEEAVWPASTLSDGTLRFICLATLLLQPEKSMPSTIIIDEPELGLHPFAVALLADVLQSVSQQHQIIVSTQSVELVNNLDADDLVVVDIEDGASILTRPDKQQLAVWLEDYSLGEIWKANLI